MYIAGDEEIEAVAAAIRGKALFRYGVGNACDRFEARYAAYLGVKHFALAASGSNALAAAMTAVGLGPGDEVLIPAHTYMASATSVLAAGAIPVIVDIDETVTIDPRALEDAIGPRTKAVVPVHMWGAACAMDAIMEIAARRNLIVIEDACQGVGGGYEGRKFGSIGHIGAFSFNYYKNMTSGEGGGVAVNDERLAKRVRCAIDPCHFYWNGRDQTEMPFAGNGARASELMGAMLNVQLDRIDGMIQAMRAEKRKILRGTAQLGNIGLQPSPVNSPDHDCAPQVMYTLPSAEAAARFVKIFPSVIAGKTGRHTYTEWDQILLGAGGPIRRTCAPARSRSSTARSWWRRTPSTASRRPPTSSTTSASPPASPSAACRSPRPTSAKRRRWTRRSSISRSRPRALSAQVESRFCFECHPGESHMR